MPPRRSFGPNTNVLGVVRDPYMRYKQAVDRVNKATDFYNDLSAFNRERELASRNRIFEDIPPVDDATAAESRVRMRNIGDIYDNIHEITKHDYGMKLLDNKAEYLIGRPIPRDVLSFKVADFLQRAPEHGLRNALTKADGPNAILANVKKAESKFQSALEYPDLVNRDIIDRSYIDESNL